jgi:hypothetical protein
MDNTIGKFKREIVEVSQFYVDDNNEPAVNTIFKRNLDGRICYHNPTHHLYDYLGSQGVILQPNLFDAEIANNPPEGENEEVKETVEQNPVQPISEPAPTVPSQPQAVPQQVAQAPVQTQQPVVNPQPVVTAQPAPMPTMQAAQAPQQMPQVQAQGQVINAQVQPQIPAVPIGTA